MIFSREHLRLGLPDGPLGWCFDVNKFFSMIPRIVAFHKYSTKIMKNVAAGSR